MLIGANLFSQRGLMFVFHSGRDGWLPVRWSAFVRCGYFSEHPLADEM
jgi:hypothetical protein